MSLKEVDKGLDTVDSMLTKIGNILKKHWKLLLILLFCWGVYWVFTTDNDYEYYENEQEQIEEGSYE